MLVSLRGVMTDVGSAKGGSSSYLGDIDLQRLLPLLQRTVLRRITIARGYYGIDGEACTIPMDGLLTPPHHVT